MYCFRAKEPQNQTAVISAAEGTRPHPACPFSYPLSGSAPVKRAVCLSTRSHVKGRFLQSPIAKTKKKTQQQPSPTPKDAPTLSPLHFSLLALYRVPTRGNASILTRDKLRDEGVGGRGEKGGDGWVWVWGESVRGE